jgi:hydrogenase-4 component F
MELLIVLCIPALGAAVSMIAPSRRVAAGTTVLGALVVLLLSLRVAVVTASGTDMVAVKDWVSCDGMGALLLLLTSFVGFTAALFSWGYVAKTSSSDRSEASRRYYSNLNLFLLSLLAVPVLAHIALVWIAVELTTLLSVFLVSYEDTPEALEAAWKYVMLTCMGAAIALIGILMLYWAMAVSGGGPFTWQGLVTASSRMPPALLMTAFLFILVGFGTKAGLVPLHTWLPDAHSQAPSPVCALLSGVETSAVLYAILRLLPVLQGIDGAAASWCVAFGLISTVAAAFLLIQVKDYKRLFAFSTIEHMGIILVGAGLGGADAQLGATYQLMNHAIAKSFCFYAAGAALLISGVRYIPSVRGLIRTSPITGASLILGGLAISGAPPFAVFFSEISILRAGLRTGHYLVVGLLSLSIVVAFCGIMFHVTRLVFGKPSSESVAVALPRSCVGALALAAIPVLGIGLYVPQWITDLLGHAAAVLGR